MKKVSVIISVYNCEEYIEDCLQSLEYQTMKKSQFEVIIINDGSTDSTLKIIKRFLKNNEEWILIDRENKGLSYSRNEGLDIATGSYITFLDGDDILEQTALQVMYDEVCKNECEIGIFRTTNFNSIELTDDNYIKKFQMLPKITNLKASPLLASFIRSVAILYRKTIVDNVRFIPNVIHEDNYFCMKSYSLANKIYISESYVYKIRRREGSNLSITQSQNFDSFKDLIINIKKGDQEIKQEKLIKTHGNQIFGYMAKYVNENNINEAQLLLFDYLKLMKQKNIISFLKYLYLVIYFKLKLLKSFFKVLIIKKIKMIYLSFLTIISPKLNTKVFYKKRMGKKINLKNPINFNEKIQWLKLNYLYPNELVTNCADKVKVRNYISEIGCGEILNDVIGIYDTVEEINFEELPNKFVLKWNFGCGYNIICQNKEKLNLNVTRKKLKKWGKSKFHLYNSELHYKNIKRKIICEKFIDCENKKLPDDYKFYCFNGKAEYVMICSARDTGNTKFYFFDRNWKLVELNKQTEMAKKEKIKIEKPKNIDDMFEYADKLSAGFPFVRVDLYNSNGKIYFGELTFTPSAGLDKGYTIKGDSILASKIQI